MLNTDAIGTAATDAQAAAPVAETQGKDSETRLREAESALTEARAALERSERRVALDAALMESGVIDLETARLVAERALAAMKTPDIGAAVAELRKTKAFLFKAPAPPSAPARQARASAMSARAREEPVAIVDAAQEAAATGDRASLLRYLRMRRGV